MVALMRLGKRGAGRRGCLLVLLLSAVGMYYGVNIGGVYMKYYRMEAEMRSQARLAPSLNDPTIRRRLAAKAAELNLPEEADRQIRIRRSRRPREITITTSWHDDIELPFYKITVTLSPQVKARL